MGPFYDYNPLNVEVLLVAASTLVTLLVQIPSVSIPVRLSKQIDA